MVKQIAEVGDEATPTRLVVVGAEYRREARVTIERVSDANERVIMDLDVCIDENEDVARGSTRSAITRSRWANARRLLNDDDLLRAVDCRPHGRECAVQGRPAVSRRDNDGEASHRQRVDGRVRSSTRPFRLRVAVQLALTVRLGKCGVQAGS
jgi:hypothetical protein